MKTFKVLVTQVIEVTLDETKFDPAFYDQYNQLIGDIGELEEHASHLGWLNAARGIDDYSFIEGYGPASEMGITFREIYTDSEISA